MLTTTLDHFAQFSAATKDWTAEENGEVIFNTASSTFIITSTNESLSIDLLAEPSINIIRNHNQDTISQYFK